MNPYFYDLLSGQWLYGHGDEAFAWNGEEWVPASREQLQVLSDNNFDSSEIEDQGAPPDSDEPPPSGAGDDWRTGFSTAGRNVITPFSTNDVDRMAEQNRLFARDWGNILDQDTRDAQSRAQDQEQNFLRRAMASYDPILRGRGGYNATEAQNLIQRDLIEGGMTTEDELADLQMRDWEQDMVLGNPWAPVDEAKGALSGVRGDIDVNADTLRSIYRNYGDRIDRAIDPSRLAIGADYDPSQQEVIDDAAESYGQINDPARLGLSGDYLRDYRWTDRDTQDLMDRAARTVANRGAARRDYLEREAAANGNASPEALAAADTRGRVDEDTAAAEAILAARMAGRGRELDVTGERERMRLEAERDQAGRLTDAVRDVTGMRLDQGTRTEQMRLGAEQGLSDRMVAGYGDVARTAMGAEGNIGNAYTDLGKYGSGLIYDATRYGDQAMREGGQQAYQNRTNASNTANTARFGQAMDAATALKQGYGAVYGQRKQEEAEGRGFLTGQQNAATANANAIRGQRISAAGTSIGGVNDATQLAIGTKHIPTALEKGAALTIGAIGALKPK